MKPEKILDDWPESPAEALLVVERYYHLSIKFSHQFDFSLTLFQMPVSDAEVLAVVHAEDKLAAAKELISRKMDRWQ